VRLERPGLKPSKVTDYRLVAGRAGGQVVMDAAAVDLDLALIRLNLGLPPEHRLSAWT
jgi:hypothetical protein